MTYVSTPRPDRPFPAQSGLVIWPRGERDAFGKDDIAVCWLLTENANSADVRRWFAMLDLDERARAERFHFEEDRRDFIAAHALLRATLTSCWGLPAAAWRFLDAAGGKPAIAPGLNAPGIAFNLSHTRGLVAVAVGSYGAIGVDVERVEQAKADFTVAETYFAPAETALLRRTPEADRPSCFFRLWTLKEAYVKAVGAGLAAPLDTFTFALDPIRFDFCDGALGDALDWRFAIVPTTDRHVLSVAVGREPGDGTRLTSRGFAPQDL
jgi:4'-phosphopantetheinyl transferase